MDTLCQALPSGGLTADYDGFWLRQATRLRDRALRLAESRFSESCAAERQDERVAGSAAPSEISCATALRNEYLVESEKMADLMREMARKGLLAPDAAAPR